MQSISDFPQEKFSIAIAADHGGFEAKNQLAAYLTGAGYSVMDCGPFVFDAADDLPLRYRHEHCCQPFSRSPFCCCREC